MGNKYAYAQSVRQAVSNRGIPYVFVAVAAASLTMLLTSSPSPSVLLPPATMYMHAHRRAMGSVSNHVPLSSTMCKHQYTVTTWDGKQAPVCDPTLCDATPPLMKPPPKNSPTAARRWTDANDAAYAAASQDVVGWLVENQVRYVRTLTAFQHSLGIYGAAGEIGVHHGKFFAPIAGNAVVGEPVVAIDLFEA